MNCWEPLQLMRCDILLNKKLIVNELGVSLTGPAFYFIFCFKKKNKRMLLQSVTQNRK